MGIRDTQSSHVGIQWESKWTCYSSGTGKDTGNVITEWKKKWKLIVAKIRTFEFF